MGRPGPHARSAGGFRGARGLEDAAALRGSRRLPDPGRARSRGHETRGRRAPRREGHQRGVAGSRRPAVPALGPAQRPAQALPRAGLRPANGRRFPRARQQRVSRVLHLLSAPHPRRVSHPVSGQPGGRACLSLRTLSTSVHHLSRSAVHGVPRANARDRRRDRGARARAHVRVRDQARSTRHGGARSAACGGAARHQFRRGIGVCRNSQEGRPPADPSRAAARWSSTIADSWAS